VVAFGDTVTPFTNNQSFLFVVNDTGNSLLTMQIYSYQIQLITNIANQQLLNFMGRSQKRFINVCKLLKSLVVKGTVSREHG
jgi:hypothetical protein